MRRILRRSLAFATVAGRRGACRGRAGSIPLVAGPGALGAVL